MIHRRAAAVLAALWLGAAAAHAAAPTQAPLPSARPAVEAAAQIAPSGAVQIAPSGAASSSLAAAALGVATGQGVASVASASLLPAPDARPTPAETGEDARQPLAARASAASPPLAGPSLGAPVLAQVRPTGQVGFLLIDVETGQVLDAHAPAELIAPASVAKLVTALYALEILGPDHRFETRLVAESPLSADGRLTGALALVGAGDPDLDTDDLAELIAQARGRGLRQVDGPLLLDLDGWPSLPQIEPDQPAEAAYNPAVSGINLNYNRVLFGWSRAPDGARKTQLLAHGRQLKPETRAIRLQLSDAPAPVFAWSEGSEAEGWQVAEAALDREGQRWLPVRNPETYAADALRQVAASQGLALPAPRFGSAPQGGPVLAFRRGPPLETVSRQMLRWSTNLTAESLGLAATRARGLPAPDLLASAQAMSDWAAARAGVAPEAFALRNHSGLSAHSRATPEALAALLRAAATGPRGDFGRAGPGLLGAQLREVNLDPARGEARLPASVGASGKTGTMHYVRGLAGYLTPVSGRPLAFVILSNDLDRRAEAADGRATGASRAWLGRAREMERRLLRTWAAAL